MGGILSKNTQENQTQKEQILNELELSKTIAESICEESNDKLNKIYENVNKLIENNKPSKVFNISIVKNIDEYYNEALTLIDCHNPESSLYKAKIKWIYQTYIKNLSMFIQSQLNDVIIELNSALNDIKNENNDPMVYGAYMNERLTLINNGITNLEQLQVFYLYRDNFILDLIEFFSKERDSINNVYAKYSGTYDLYKRFILSKYYAIGIGPIDENRKVELIREQLTKIQEYFDIDTYKYLMKFSELVPILYPTWPINETNNQYLEITDINTFYNWVQNNNYFNVNTADVQSRFVYLMSYYSSEVMNKTIPDHSTLTWFTYYEELFDKIEEQIRDKTINNESTLFETTKKIYKLLGINHWKSIKFYANLNPADIDETEQLYIPSNYPLFSPKLETLTTVLYSFNKLVETYGNKEKKGGRFFEDPNIFHYDDIFYNHFEDPVLIQISNIKSENNSLLSDTQKIFAKRLRYYEEVCDNTFAWYAFVNGDTNILSTIFNEEPMTYLELFETNVYRKYDNTNNIPTDLDFNERYELMKSKIKETTKSIQSKNLNHVYITNYTNIFENTDLYIDEENDLDLYINSTTNLLVFELANSELDLSPTDITSDNLILFYDKTQTTELSKKEQAETNNLFGFLSAAYLIGTNIEIPNSKIIFELTTNSLKPNDLKTNHPLYNLVNIAYLFNYSDYMTYTTNTTNTIKVSNLVNFIYQDTIVNNKNFALIIPLYPTAILNDYSYYNTINYNDYNTCVNYENILNNYSSTQNITQDEIIFDNMLQRSTFYMKSDESF